MKRSKIEFLDDGTIRLSWADREHVLREPTVEQIREFALLIDADERAIRERRAEIEGKPELGGSTSILALPVRAETLAAIVNALSTHEVKIDAKQLPGWVVSTSNSLWSDLLTHWLSVPLVHGSATDPDQTKNPPNRKR